MTINYLVLLIILFFMSMLSLLIYVTLNFVLKSNIFKIRFNNKKIIIFKNIFIKILQIIFVSSISLIITFFPQFDINIINNSNILISIFYIPLLLTIGVLFDWWLSLFLAISMLISISIEYSIFISNENNFLVDTIFQILTIFVCLINIGVNKLYNKSSSNRFVVIASFLSFFIILLLNIAIFIKQTTLLYMLLVEIVIVWLTYLLSYKFSYLFLQFLKKMDLINENIIYENKYFFNYEKSFKKITEYIKTNKTTFGLLIVFNIANFENLKTNWGNNNARSIQNEFLNKIIESIKPINPLFFMTNANNYACFIPISLNTNDLSKIYLEQGDTSTNNELYLIQKYLQNIPKKISYKNKIFKTNLGAYGSIYGLHSCDISELIQLCYLTKRKSYTLRKTNILEIYDPNKIGININISNKDNETIKWFKQKFQINLHLLKNNLNNKNIYYPDISYVDNLLFNINEIKTFAQEQDDYIQVIRAIAMQVLKKFVKLNDYENSLIIIDYPIEFISNSNFNLGDLRTKLNFLNIHSHQIIFRLDMDDFNQNKHLINIKYIEILKELGFKFLFNNFSYSQLEIFKNILPDYINFKNIKLNKNDLSLSILKELKKLNIEVIF